MSNGFNSNIKWDIGTMSPSKRKIPKVIYEIYNKGSQLRRD